MQISIEMAIKIIHAVANKDFKDRASIIRYLENGIKEEAKKKADKEKSHDS